jgi:cell division septum initiation protein DivIVA
LFPDVNNLNLRPNPRDFKFERELNGYKKQAVDDKITELFRQIDGLTAQNSRLNGAMEQFDEKIRVLTDSTKQLEQERIHENMRLANVMTNAGKTAEETVAQARLQAEQIIADALLEGQKALDAALREANAVSQQANAEATAMRDALNSLNQTLLVAHQSSSQYFNSMNTILSGALHTLPEAPAPKPPPTPASAPPIPEVTPLYSPSAASAQVPEDLPPAADQYEQMLKSMGLTPDDMTPKNKGDCLGHFGSTNLS